MEFLGSKHCLVKIMRILPTTFALIDFRKVKKHLVVQETNLLPHLLRSNTMNHPLNSLHTQIQPDAVRPLHKDNHDPTLVLHNRVTRRDLKRAMLHNPESITTVNHLTVPLITLPLPIHVSLRMVQTHQHNKALVSLPCRMWPILLMTDIVHLPWHSQDRALRHRETQEWSYHQLVILVDRLLPLAQSAQSAQ